ncbi:hypothetical protein [Halococcus saccharolyticus]|uniref:Uncharacterized protein n=1 Tax=Halococcus saccharolyticus DSM 5350 TaxID=1227455 RepID=M0MTC0_9EURY|nr:hypothetical protein [Halococcus saccharolyticus]EMA47979.1 hypothetical protein C449_00865 [Halococcus saccharolyticus DSM 5350]
MPSEDPDESRPIVLRPKEEFYAPVYPALSDAPSIEGITVAIDGSGADPAGIYDYIGGQWSGPHGGPSNLPDSIIDESTTVANTESYTFEEYLTATEDASDPKRVNLDVDTSTLDTRYLKRVSEDFEVHPLSDPGSDAPATPQGFRFEPGPASAAAQGGYFYADSPDTITSTQSFGCDFVNTTAPDGSTISSSTWALATEYAVGAGGHDLSVSVYARPTADYTAYDDGQTHSDSETFTGEDDAFIDVRCYDSSLQPLSLATTTQYSATASEQYFAAGNTTSLSGSTWVSLTHTASLPAEATFVEVRIQTADNNDMWASRGTVGSGNASILFDDYNATYAAGLRRSAVLDHDHDTAYYPRSEANNQFIDESDESTLSVASADAATTAQGVDSSGTSAGDILTPNSSGGTQWQANTGMWRVVDEASLASGAPADQRVTGGVGANEYRLLYRVETTSNTQVISLRANLNSTQNYYNLTRQTSGLREFSETTWHLAYAENSHHVAGRVNLSASTGGDADWITMSHQGNLVGSGREEGVRGHLEEAYDDINIVTLLSGGEVNGGEIKLLARNI